MKRTLFVFSLLCLFFGKGYAAEIWSIGTKNNSNAEFRTMPMSPEEFAPFAEKGFSVTIPNDGTAVDPKSVPGSLPGERDVWAGSKSHFMTINFDLPANFNAKAAALFLELNGKPQHPLPPVLEITLNDSKQTLRTKSEPGEPWLSFKVPFAPDVLKPKGNTLRIANTKGSWFQFDSMRLIALTGKVETIRVTPLPGIMRMSTELGDLDKLGELEKLDDLRNQPMRRVHIDFNGETLKNKAEIEI
jgi:hypothetical protein